QQLIKNDPKAEDVGSPVDSIPPTSRLLWAHVGRSSHEVGSSTEVFVAQGHAKVGQKWFHRCFHENVGGLDITVNESSCVCVMQPLGDCEDDLGGLLRRGSRSGQESAKISTFNVSRHDVEESVVGPAGVEDRQNAGVVEVGQNQGFVQECANLFL